MSDPLVNYFENQAGSGISGFQGVRFQKGHNIFGRAFKFIFPVLKYLGKQFLNTGINVASDVLEHDKPIKESIKTRAKQGIKDTAMDGLEMLRQVQKGKGTNRKKASKSTTKKAVKRKKVVKTKRKKKQAKKTLHDKLFNG